MDASTRPIDLREHNDTATLMRSRWRGTVGLATQFALVFAAAIAYFGVRGLTEGSQTTAVSHGRAVMGFEHSLRVDVEPALQNLVLDHTRIVTLANWVYIWGHWPVIAITLAWLYRRHRDSYFLLRNAMFVSGAIGLVTFMTFPVAPPRLASLGLVDTVTELSTSYRVLQPPALINEFAAVPSLHVGWNLLVGVMIYRSARSLAARAFALAGPILMSLAVVLTANHYLFDVAAGAVVALTGFAIVVAARHVDALSSLRFAISRPRPVAIPLRLPSPADAHSRGMSQVA
ncbi:MAG: phosphatase PAP2 family protein [Acidimicrobiales bacterium]